MNPTVPTRLMSAERAAVVAEGAQRAVAVIAVSFPPRPEDEDGSLAVQEVELLTNRLLHAELSGPGTTLPERRWWLEGLVLGYCAAATDALEKTTHWWEMTAGEHLDGMEASVVSKVSAEQADANVVVFEMCRALLADDDVALLWAVENAWRPARGLSADLLRERIRSVLMAALGVCCTAWTLLLAAERSDLTDY